MKKYLRDRNQNVYNKLFNQGWAPLAGLAGLFPLFAYSGLAGFSVLAGFSDLAGLAAAIASVSLFPFP